MKRIFLFFVAACLYVSVGAQTLVPITWTPCGLTFKAPKGILVEDDTDDTFLINNNRISMTIESVESEGLEKDKLVELLKTFVTDEEVQDMSAITEFDLPQFHGYSIKGRLEEDICRYAFLMTKETDELFYLAIIYKAPDEKMTDTMLKSFRLVEK